MKKITDKEFTDFLLQKPLYSKIIAVENLTNNQSDYIYYESYIDKTFSFLCPEEKEIQTFKTKYSYGVQSSLFGYFDNNDDRLPHTFNDETKKLDLTINLDGICQSCKYKISFSLRINSDKSWDEKDNGINIYIQKVGQYPPYDIGLQKNLKEYLSDEDKENYKKALLCLSVSYGIGAYAYLRRVVENEIKRIIKDISELTFDGSEKVKEALRRFQEDHQMSKVIDVINQHLPSSLKEIGDNPIRLLYELLSGGIHEFTDEQCMEKAQSIDKVLNYVIEKINEEKYQINSVKEAMKKLRN